MTTLYTVGHSTRTLEELFEVLRANGIQRLVDIRAFPMSRRLPHFNRENLERALPQAGIEYVWMKALGGRRGKLRDDSPHLALRSPGFRYYADHMLTGEFQQAAAELVRMADEKPTAYMCAERLYFRCHRMLVSDYLVAHGHRVLHLEEVGREPRAHKLTAEARVREGRVIYSGDRLL